MASKKNCKLDIKFMCRFAKVSRSGYYAFLKNSTNIDSKGIQDKIDYALIKEAFDYKGWKKGARQIKMRIERDHCITMNLKKIRRLMKLNNLICPIRKVNPVKAMLRESKSHHKYPNILDRNFNQGVSKKTLLTDITYITYGNGKRAYLSVLKDSSTKLILGWKVSKTLELDFVLETINQLIEEYGTELDVNVLINSDQGVHYTSIAYQELLKSHDITQSMSRRGNCWDNAPQESFFAILKTEMELKNYYSFETMALSITDFINYYNYDRPQIGINKMTPYEYDQYLSDSHYRSLQLPTVIQ